MGQVIAICPSTKSEEPMVWLDWMIIACVVLLAAVLFKIWRERQSLVNDLYAEAREVDPFSVATGDAERDQRPVQAYQGATEWMSSAGPRISSRYQLKFEQMRRGAGDEEVPLWEAMTTLAFADQAKVPHGLEHFQGVSRLAAQIAMQMRLSEAEIEEVRVAGIVHDIGKTHVPDPVRLKVKLLTAAEFEIMKNHADWGARILEPLGEEGIARIVRHHHERYDGTGYPDHLKGEDIPLGARIVGLAECFDSMISDQDYKAPRTLDDAVAEVRRCSGTQFDPNVVRAFLRDRE
jgi:putative nucleotidyltransferase with HDIG domain